MRTYFSPHISGVKRKMQISTKISKVAVLSLRTKLGMTQDEFAQAVGCSGSTVGHWEGGRAAPRGVRLRKLLEMCPDNETRGLFTSPLAPHKSLESPAEDGHRESKVIRNASPELRRIRKNLRAMVLRLQELDRLGNPVAKEYLLQTLDTIARTASIATEPGQEKNRRAGILAEEIKKLRRLDI
jgi:transcriptional regulator with XRE-family HTH domain